MGKAEDMAFKRCPKSENVIKEMRNEIRRAIFTEGYHQAEKDLELTWEDISKIRKILCGMVGYPLMTDKEVCAEVLKRFKAQKGEEEYANE